jgi:hypothetical protein
VKVDHVAIAAVDIPMGDCCGADFELLSDMDHSQPLQTYEVRVDHGVVKVSLGSSVYS